MTPMPSARTKLPRKRIPHNTLALVRRASQATARNAPVSRSTSVNWARTTVIPKPLAPILPLPSLVPVMMVTREPASLVEV